MNDSFHQYVSLDAFGPSRPDAFDFTLLFEESFFTIAPASLFLIAAFGRTASLYRSSPKVALTPSRQIKTGFLSALVALNLILLVLWATTPAVTTKASVPAASLEFVAAGALLVLSSYEHTRSVAPSTLIAIYLMLTILLDIARVRTLFLLDSAYPTKSIAAVFAISVVIKLGVLISEASTKRGILLERYRELSPEATSGPYSRILFWWINPLLRRGFNSIFEIDDLYKVDETLSSAVLGADFQARWDAQKATHTYTLLKTILYVLKWSIVGSAIPRALLIGLTFVQPFLIRRTIEYVGNRNDQPSNIGWSLVGAYAVVYTGLALLTASSNYLINRFVVKIRGGLVSLIYKKTVDLSITALEDEAVLTLMSTDVERVTKSFINLHAAWAALVQVAIGLYLLYTNLGGGFIAPAVCFLCALLAMTVCTRMFPRFQTIWVQGIQSRVSSTSSMLGSMRSIKLLGISVVVGDLIQQLRFQENVLARKFRWLLLFQVLFQNITAILAPVATFAVYVIQANFAGKSLDAATAFSILSILQLIEPSLMELIRTFPALVASHGSLVRIQKFLISASRQDHRLPLLQSSREDLASSGEDDIPLESMNGFLNSVLDDALVLKDCSFGWSPDKPLVHNIDFEVKSGSLCMIIGPTGCGKSTLIKGILGETPSSSGFVYLGTDSIAFADQDPWTINSTIKDGVCGESSVDEGFYQEVIDCCGLREDLKSWPKNDKTVVGSKGISLSGGQKARLALARAIFARKKMLVLDDVFSGTDADTEEHIFRSLFSGTGLLRRSGTTIILVTHAVARLPYADWVIALNKDGSIAEQGTYDQLREAGAYVANLDVHFKETSEGPADQLVGRKSSTKTDETEEVTNTSTRNTGDWNTYKHYFTAAGWKSVVSTAVSSFTYIAAIKAPGLLVKYFTGLGSTTSSNDVFMAILGSTAAVSIFCLALLVWLVFLDMVPRASNGLHQSLLRTILHAPLSFFTKTDSGTTLNRFSEDLSLIDNELPSTFIAAVLCLALFLIGGGLMAATATYSLPMIPVVISILYVVQRFYLRTSRQLRHLDLEQKAPLYTHFQETLSGLPSIRAFGWVDQFRSKNSDLLDRSQRPVYLLLCIQTWLALVLDLLVSHSKEFILYLFSSFRESTTCSEGLKTFKPDFFNAIISQLGNADSHCSRWPPSLQFF